MLKNRKEKRMIKNKKILTLMLALCVVCLSIFVIKTPISAQEKEVLKTIDRAATISVAVPTSFGFKVNNTGGIENTTKGNQSISNQGSGCVEIQNIQVDLGAGWNLNTYDSFNHTNPSVLGKKEFALKIDGVDAKSSLLSQSICKAIGVLEPSTTGNSSRVSHAFTTDAKIPIQYDSFTANVATIVFTVGEYSTEGSAELPNIEDYYTYTYDPATNGYILGLSEDFGGMLSSWWYEEEGFWDSEGNHLAPDEPLPNPGNIYCGSNGWLPVTKTTGMFADLGECRKLYLSKFDVSNVVDMSNMFSNSEYLQFIDLLSFTINNVTTSNMFDGLYYAAGLVTKEQQQNFVNLGYPTETITFLQPGTMVSGEEFQNRLALLDIDVYMDEILRVSFTNYYEIDQNASEVDMSVE